MTSSSSPLRNSRVGASRCAPSCGHWSCGSAGVSSLPLVPPASTITAARARSSSGFRPGTTGAPASDASSTPITWKV
ncbi:hypothetical protein [Rhodanobacter thiooxydans]|uniref:hypothetical protein n=1 Tax=Rhodanobacter thiooxydans TaxID=416169 RepID=UPI0031B59DF9